MPSITMWKRIAGRAGRFFALANRERKIYYGFQGPTEYIIFAHFAVPPARFLRLSSSTR